MKKMIAVFFLFAISGTSRANNLAHAYDSTLNTLKNEVHMAYERANLQMSNNEMLNQITTIQSSFASYIDLSQQIRERFRQKDIQLFADLNKINSKYCSLDVEEEEEDELDDVFLALINPLFLLIDDADTDEGEVVFRLSRYGELKEMNRQLNKEEYRIKSNKPKSKRYLRKLTRLKDKLNFINN